MDSRNHAYTDSHCHCDALRYTHTHRYRRANKRSAPERVAIAKPIPCTDPRHTGPQVADHLPVHPTGTIVSDGCVDERPAPPEYEPRRDNHG